MTTIYTTDPELLAAGAEKYQLGTAWCWFQKKPDGHYDYSHVNGRAIENACHFSQYDYPLLIDIEAFDFSTDYPKAIRNLRTAVEWWKHIQPQRQIGFYMVMPVRDYWRVVNQAEYLAAGNIGEWMKWSQLVNDWQAMNDRIHTELWSLVDFLCPSVYSVYADEPIRRWCVYAEANIAEAGRLAWGKPVYPILMPSYGSGPIDPGKWQTMVNLCVQHPESFGLALHIEGLQHPGWREPIKALLQEPVPVVLDQ